MLYTHTNVEHTVRIIFKCPGAPSSFSVAPARLTWAFGATDSVASLTRSFTNRRNRGVGHLKGLAKHVYWQGEIDVKHAVLAAVNHPDQSSPL